MFLMNRIVIISTGPGNPQYLLPIAHQVIAQSQVLIGRLDLLDLWEHQNKVKLTVNMNNLFHQLIEFQNKYELTAVLISGDATLFSLLNNFHFPLNIEVIPGISSFQYFCSRLKINWNTLKIINLHGNKKLSPFILALEQGYEMMVFTGGLHSATDLLKIAALVSPNRRGTLGVNLSLPGEFIQSGTVQELCSTHLSQSDLALIYLSPGRKFWEAGFKQWGRKMQDDITDGVKWLIQKGIADPKRIAIYGGSYGGYAVLAGLTFTPDLYAAGIDYVGVSNIFTLLETIPPYWEQGRQMLYEMIGDPEKDRDLLQSASPVFHADKIRAPLLVAQGANDPRVKKAESDQIVEALRHREVDVKYIVKENEGHGFRNEENRFDFYREMEQFLAKHLDGMIC
jgi:precorrin-6B methylase 1/dienelactone hydrolase